MNLDILLLNDIRFAAVDRADMRASDLHAAIRRKITHCVKQNALNIWIIIGRKRLVSGLEIKNLAVSAFPQTTGTQNLTAGKRTDKQQFVRRWDYKRFPIGFFLRESEIAVNSVFDGITEALKTDGKIQLVGFGTFAVKERAARTGVNPKTGEKIEIAAGKAPSFAAGKSLKDAIQ